MSKLIGVCVAIAITTTIIVYSMPMPPQSPATAQAEKHRGPSQYEPPPQIVVKSEPLVIPADIVWRGFMGLAAVVGGMGFYVWKKREKDLEDVEEKLSGKVDQGDYDENRREMLAADERLRNGIIACHSKMEQIDVRAQQRHEKLIEVLNGLKNR